MKQPREEGPIAKINQLYDSRMHSSLIDEYYGGSGFLNFGYWDQSVHNAKEASENLVKKLLAFIPTKKGRILDVACGTGATTRYLLRYFRPEDVVGINISEKQLATCHENLPGVTFLLMDAVKLDFGDRSFDNMICVEAAFHFDTREQFFKEAYRTLKPGGSLVLSDVLISETQKQFRPHWPAGNFITDLGEYEKMCRRAGFFTVQIVDATQACWKPNFWSIVRFAHEKFLSGLITIDELNALLERIYRLAADLEYYILVAATK